MLLTSINSIYKWRLSTSIKNPCSGINTSYITKTHLLPSDVIPVHLRPALHDLIEYQLHELRVHHAAAHERLRSPRPSGRPTLGAAADGPPNWRAVVGHLVHRLGRWCRVSWGDWWVNTWWTWGRKTINFENSIDIKWCAIKILLLWCVESDLMEMALLYSAWLRLNYGLKASRGKYLVV